MRFVMYGLELLQYPFGMADALDRVRPCWLPFVKREKALNASFCLYLEDAGCEVAEGTGSSVTLTVVCESADLSSSK